MGAVLPFKAKERIAKDSIKSALFYRPKSPRLRELDGQINQIERQMDDLKAVKRALLSEYKKEVKRRTRILVSAIVGASLGACAMSTGILPAGPDTFTITERDAPVRGGATQAERDALTEANAYCSALGRQMLPTDMQTPPTRNPWGPTSFSVAFQCLKPGDPRLEAGGSTRSPDSIVQTRER